MSQQRANLLQRGNGGGDASKVVGWGGRVKKENKLKQEQRKKGQLYATRFFPEVGLFMSMVYVMGSSGTLACCLAL